MAGVPGYRIRVAADVDGRSNTVDVAVNGRIAVGMLIPSLVDLIGGPPSRRPATRWHLGRPVGPPLDESLSLEDNGIRDGDVLTLDRDAPPASPVRSCDPARRVADRTPATAGPDLREPAAGSIAVIVAATLAWTGVHTTSWVPLIAALGGALATSIAGWSRRSVALTIGAVALSTAAGFAAVPGGPAAPNAFLGTTAGLATVVVVSRALGRVDPTLVAVGVCGALLVGTTALAVVTALPIATYGAILTIGALASLGAAPRIAAMAAAHDVLTGLVAGCAAGSVVGACTVAVGCLGETTRAPAAAGFVAVAGLVLALRVRTYVDAARRRALAGAGVVCVGAAMVVVCVTQPGIGSHCTAAILVVALAVVQRWPTTPSATRALDLLDYAALAAVGPLAAWLVGLYELARNWSLT